jgi:hypothetical protein
MLHHFSFHRVVNDVPAVIEEFLFPIHQPCSIASLQYRTYTLIFPVVELTVELVELFHPGDHVGIGSFKQDVVVGAHEAIGMTDPVVLFDHSQHERDEFDPVLLVMKDGHPSDASAYDMIHGAWILNPQGSGHFAPPFFCPEREQE